MKQDNDEEIAFCMKICGFDAKGNLVKIPSHWY